MNLSMATGVGLEEVDDEWCLLWQHGGFARCRCWLTLHRTRTMGVVLVA